MNISNILTVNEVARATGISREAVWRHIKLKHLPAIKLAGYQWVVLAEDLQHWLRDRLAGKFCTAGRPRKQ